MKNPESLIGLLSAFILVIYAAHILFFTFGWWRLIGKKRKKDIQPRTFLSVIVALRNEKENISILLNHLHGQDYPLNLYEVILAEDHSTDGTPEEIERILEEEKFPNFRMISLENYGLAGSKKGALEAGIAQAKGELIIVTDADCRMGSNWLRTVAGEYQSSGCRMLAGPVMLHTAGGIGGSFQELEFYSLVATGAGAFGAGAPIFCNGANMAFSRSAFMEVNGYSGSENYSSGDDVFLLHKMKKKFGSKAVGFIPDKQAVITTDPKPGWRGFFSQRIRWASKTKGYKDLISITTALSVFLINLCLLGLLISGLFQPFYLGIFGLLFFMKMMIDFPMMLSITSFFRRKRLMFWFVPFELIYIFYVVLAGFVSLFYGGKWKGREVNHGILRHSSAFQPVKGPPDG